MGEAKKIFTKNDPYFDGMVKKYVSMEEDAELIPDETKEMVKTVKQQLEETQQSIITALDATISKEETNAANVAKAELEVDGVVFGTFSATTLLALESQLNKILELYKSIPLLDTTRKWHFDTQQGFYKTDEEVKFRSIKRPQGDCKIRGHRKASGTNRAGKLGFSGGKI
mgnify:CR=1 FL=1